MVELQESILEEAHLPCPACSSSDAFSWYSDHGYCFSCQHYESREGVKPRKLRSHKKRNLPSFEGEFIAIPSRGLYAESFKKFNVRVETTSRTLRFPYTDASGQITGWKEKTEDKKFSVKGEIIDKRLFGQNLFGGGKSLVITEGELDTVAVWQARPNWPVMSVSSGCKGAKSQISAQLPALLKFEEIILLFDKDKPGREAAEECARLFPPDRVFIAELEGDYKDACDAIKDKNPEAIRQAIWNKRAYSPKAIINGKDLFDLISQPLRSKDADWPYPSLNNLSGGLRLGEMICLTSGTGSGKSTFTGEVCQALLDQNFTVAYIALEESIKRQALRIMTVKANKPLHLNNEIPKDELHKTFDESIGSGRLFLRDGFGSINCDHLISDIRFLVKHHGAQFVIIDHLSILVSGIAAETDERKMIDRVVTELRSFVEETQINLIMVSHLRRIQGDKGHEDGAKISLSHLRGSNSISQLSDQVISLSRDISSGSNTSELTLLKNRWSGQCGPCGTLTYSKETGRLVEFLNSETTNDTYEDF